MTRICPECNTAHDLAKYKGCCSRGCMYRLNRRNAPAPAPRAAWPTPRPLARKVIHVTPPHMEPPPPVVDAMIVCQCCGVKSPDWATFEIGGKAVCVSCRPKWKAHLERAFTGGSGVRVIRKTGGLT